jgi:hypothetical protein
LGKHIHVIDAMMGRGKSSAAIRYMNENKGKRRFLYATPFLTEVDRICEECGFLAPDGEEAPSKSSSLIELLHKGANIATTHQLFYLMKPDTLELVREKHYTLMIDENIQAVEKVLITDKDYEIVTSSLTETDEEGRVRWLDEDYEGKFSEYKGIADQGCLYLSGSAMFSIMNPDLLEAFDEVYMMTYLFDENIAQAYLDAFHFTYDITGVERDSKGFKFCDHRDQPPPFDYRKLIHIIGEGGRSDQGVNAVGAGRTALSKRWYERHSYDSPDMQVLRKNMYNFFRNTTKSRAGDRMWTTFKNQMEKLIEPNGRFRDDYLQIMARATNDYADRWAVAYMANRFIDPRMANLFAQYGTAVNPDQFALAELIQWLFRSAVRNYKPIDLYLPSERMRNLLNGWMDAIAKGDGSYVAKET